VPWTTLTTTEDMRHDAVSAMAATDTFQPALRERKIEPIGTAARVIVGALLLGCGGRLSGAMR
jgi:hypothetical protein